MAFDEMTTSDGGVRAPYAGIAQWLKDTPAETLKTRGKEAELLYRRGGITFAVYGDLQGEERIIPHDIVPRVLARKEWNTLAKGLEQRVRTLNRYLADIYGPGECLKAGIIPEDLVWQNPAFRPEMVGVDVPHGIYVHIAGVDVVRIDPDTFYVLEDNARTPSGVSYMLHSRDVSLRLVPELMDTHRVAPIENYPDQLLASLRSVAPRRQSSEPTVALLTPGQFNSAYYEHSFLADKMGVELVEGRDLFVRDEVVYMRTTQGPQRVDVVYRRIDDDFIDPLSFRPDSTLGVPGLFAAYKAGNVTLANAVGTGAADDKVIYSYMPDLTKFYFGEEPILKNVQTWRCRRPDELRYVLDHLSELVVKEVHGSGGYGMLVGPHATAAQIEDFRARLNANPSNYIAQPTLSLSTCPTFVESGIAPRHVDLRPFVLSGSDGIRIVPGGLTRVALREGSLVVNSSQGGGTKDTWVIE
ncbi:MAG: circularly permuted type 2 ATP-grasp protein [Rhodospirillaceae bacterium]|nr:circularly permuted type 2 ATP-grasp protein [Rhodospirillaceae bacterium]